MNLFQIVDAAGKPLILDISNEFDNKMKAKAYRKKVDGTFASFIGLGPDHKLYTGIRGQPRNNKGHHPKAIGRRGRFV